MIDLRSDTVTRPTPAMLDAMMFASVGDDVFGEDSAINDLEQKVAIMFGLEAGLFCPSGTMANQIAIQCHTDRLDEILCDQLSHVYNYETGGYASNAGVSIRLLQGDRGRFTPKDITDNVHPDYDWLPKTSMVCVENTVNKGGGCYYTMAEMEAISKTCGEAGLKLHLDGARIFNALVALNTKPEGLGQYFNTISICLSKGLGAPVGSVLIGSKELIKKSEAAQEGNWRGYATGRLPGCCLLLCTRSSHRSIGRRSHQGKGTGNRTCRL